PQGLISEYGGQCPVLREGRIEYVPACAVAQSFDVDHECFHTSNNSPPVVEYLRQCGVQWYDYQTIRYAGHLACVKAWQAEGFLGGDAERDKQLAAELADSPPLRYDPRTDRDKVILVVRGSRSGDAAEQSHEYRIDLASDVRTGFSAMELTTSWGATLAAYHMASGRGQPQEFSTPERFVDTDWFLGQVDRRVAFIRSG
ncbi:MAG: saccharopine dehydrogenase C-terminal domain-containing protein, partial [Planctomycetota bacterium]